MERPKTGGPERSVEDVKQSLKDLETPDIITQYFESLPDNDPEKVEYYNRIIPLLEKRDALKTQLLEMYVKSREEAVETGELEAEIYSVEETINNHRAQMRTKILEKRAQTSIS